MQVLDLRYWKLTLPTDASGDGKVDEVSVGGLTNYSHPGFFHVDDTGFVVFTAQNKATTTANSTNTGGVLHITMQAQHPERYSAFSVVFGQIHALKKKRYNAEAAVTETSR